MSHIFVSFPRDVGKLLLSFDNFVLIYIFKIVGWILHYTHVLFSSCSPDHLITAP